jgi:hypothetical protein
MYGLPIWSLGLPLKGLVSNMKSGANGSNFGTFFIKKVAEKTGNWVEPR